MIILWHYRDLRTKDHAGLSYCLKTGLQTLPLYIHEDDPKKPWNIGGASKWWLHHSLQSLADTYAKLGAKLHLEEGAYDEVFEMILSKHPVKEVCFLEKFEPHLRVLDQKIQTLLEKKNIKVTVLQDTHLIHPEDVKNQSDKPFCVFTPFSKTAVKEIHFEHIPEVTKLSGASIEGGKKLDELALLPKIGWDHEFKKIWSVGEDAALNKLKAFSDDAMALYSTKRDFIAEPGTSQLSAHLAFGEISPKRIWMHCENKKNADPYLRQLLWREFGSYFIYHFSDSTDISWRKEFENYPWETKADMLKLWQEGKTGYPIVDAAMRALWKEGWMHNRARMIVASFLTKDLQIHWIEGAKWFWDTLVDADLGNNTLGWQWTAGSGPDAAPYFRVFNPILQGQKFDPEGVFVKKHIPELTKLDKKYIHAPWTAPREVLEYSGVTLGKHYPKPIVDHDKARKLALESYEKIKSKKSA